MFELAILIFLKSKVFAVPLKKKMRKLYFNLSSLESFLKEMLNNFNDDQIFLFDKKLHFFKSTYNCKNDNCKQKSFSSFSGYCWFVMSLMYLCSSCHYVSLSQGQPFATLHPSLSGRPGAWWLSCTSLTEDAQGFPSDE